MRNENFAKEVLMTIRCHYIVSLVIVFICLGAASIFAISRPNVYQSELTFKVTFNQSVSPNTTKDPRLQNISKMAESDEVKKPIVIDNNDGMYNAELLSVDYRDSAVRVQNLNTLNMFRIFVHGNTPEEAQIACQGMYEHIAAFSEKNNRFEIDGVSSSGSLVEYVRTNYYQSKDAYADYDKKNDGHVKTFDEKKEKLYENYVRWEMIYQALLMDELKSNWYNSWQIYLVDDASLPEKTIPKRTGFIIGVGFIVGILLCMVFGTIMSLLNKRLKKQ